MKIEEINRDEGYLTVTEMITRRGFIRSGRDKVSEDETVGCYIKVYNKDEDDIPVELDIFLTFQYFIAGTWNTYTRPLTDFKDTLDDLADEFATFE
ncbi:MAG: hypothetical protein GWO20_10270 [Candidatus Korarchaeota archaeon]|nr:hypothetical protein [Candidatus Korarchaeota archaeon]